VDTSEVASEIAEADFETAAAHNARTDTAQPPDVNRSAEPPAGHRHDPVVVGTLLCIVSAVGYTATNICLRDLATHADPFWTSCVKAMPTVAVALVMLAGRAWRGLTSRLTLHAFWSLVAVGLFAQLFGNAAFQWTLNAIGLALAVPITHGTMMIGGAIAGRMMLGEAVTTRAMVSMAVLIAAITTLSAGAQEAGVSVQGAAVDASDAAMHWHIALGVMMACVSGIAYAMLGVVIRRVARGNFPLCSMLLVVCSSGVVSLGVASVLRLGWDGIAATSTADWRMMLLAGAFNAAAFFALSKALHLITVVHVNLVNASQVAMAALAGVLWFHEAKTIAMGVGVAMTIVGLVAMRRR
jgi:drug/metabolite transporter (DMT)-like permease